MFNLAISVRKQKVANTWFISLCAQVVLKKMLIPVFFFFFFFFFVVSLCFEMIYLTETAYDDFNLQLGYDNINVLFCKPFYKIFALPIDVRLQMKIRGLQYTSWQNILSYTKRSWKTLHIMEKIGPNH